MDRNKKRSIMEVLADARDRLTPKGKILADYIRANPRKVVFMTTRELGAACGISESTVVRFAERLGFSGYGALIQALRDHMDAGLTLVDRLQLMEGHGPGGRRTVQIILEEIEMLKGLMQSLDMEAFRAVVQILRMARAIFVVGSRLSYTVAYYLAWSLTKIRPGVELLKGSDTTTIDRLSLSDGEGNVVVLVAMSRYPNELVRVAKAARRLGHRVVLLTDSSRSPLEAFSDEQLVAPTRHIPIFGHPGPLICLARCLLHELLRSGDGSVPVHLERLEAAYRENHIFFHPDL
ncbi:transcriptional regulator, RpiR family [Desulfacinum hydrothermale DSM 13146]|uniref:Transcriptional regulator, RpiR family n=1 Tax=Desulfacinum hydrothermale DSM 13146 TaxID=1121390 RepID=A0A1W1XHP7_9BACT|nr:MurR/RpiR family transcriptional regulator [Desulfacinum hydrothermale]SMC23028.1 transcriptional regulator, RpiR family [Desulfacinum hydrothermale DSM 13146]